jgi:phage shock protein A
MNLLERVLTLLRANLNSVVEKADDPEKALRQLQLDMRNQLVQVKTQVATAIAESRKLQKRSQEKAAEAELSLRRAEQAVQQGNDDAARTALAQYNDIQKQARRYQHLYKEQEQLVTTMRGALRQLEAKIAEVNTTIELLETRRRSALIQQRVYEALNKAGQAQNRDDASRAQDAVLDAEARARALAALRQHDLDVQLEQLSEEQTLEQQLNNLKARQRSASEPPQLPAGDAQPSPLLQPQPRSSEPARKQARNAPRAGETPTKSSARSFKNTERDQHVKKLLEDSSESSH